ncbi:MAG TPA: AAA family ATPase [Deltaproteobacteria bacterium]|nr:AAA family ATPase [Deltaproteobacteria bacterium]
MWKDILGHTREIESLRSMLHSGRIPHALLFSGLKGVGKTTVAVEFFKAVNCLNSPGDACGECRSCVKAQGSTHPDLLRLGSLGGLIKVEEVRGVLETLSLKPFEAHHRIVLVEPAEQLGEAGANALLKTLEEPTPSTLFILISHKPRLLLPTIRSRCQEILFRPIAPTQTSLSLDPAILRLTSGTVGGLGPEDSARILAMRGAILSILEGGDPLEPVSKGVPPDDEANLWVSVAESFIRDIMVLALGGEDIIHAELRTMALKEISFLQVERLLDTLHAVRRGIKQNLNLKAAFAELFLMLGRLSARA